MKAKNILTLLLLSAAFFLAGLAVALYLQGSLEAAGGAGAVAAAALEAERRRRSRTSALEDFEEVAQESELSLRELEELDSSYQEKKSALSEEVKGSSLSDLVRSENERLG